MTKSSPKKSQKSDLLDTIDDLIKVIYSDSDLTLKQKSYFDDRLLDILSNRNLNNSSIIALYEILLRHVVHILIISSHYAYISVDKLLLLVQNKIDKYLYSESFESYSIKLLTLYYTRTRNDSNVTQILYDLNRRVIRAEFYEYFNTICKEFEIPSNPKRIKMNYNEFYRDEFINEFIKLARICNLDSESILKLYKLNKSYSSTSSYSRRSNYLIVLNLFKIFVSLAFFSKKRNSHNSVKKYNVFSYVCKARKIFKNAEMIRAHLLHTKCLPALTFVQQEDLVIESFQKHDYELLTYLFYKEEDFLYPLSIKTS